MIDVLNFYAMVSAIIGVTIGLHMLRGANGQSKTLLVLMAVLVFAFIARADAELFETEWVRPLANVGVTNSILGLLAYYAFVRSSH